MSDERESELKDEERQIVVSPLFTHITVDASIVMDLGRDVEIALTRITSRPVAKQQLEDGERRRQMVKFESSNSEVARIRIAPEVAMDMAMQIIVRMIQADRVNIAGLQEVIADLQAGVTSDEADQGDNATD